MFKSNPFSKIFGANARNIPLGFTRSYDSVIRHWRNFRNKLPVSTWFSDWNSNASFKSKEQRKGFFSEYRTHSKEIGKVIFDGFGRNSNLMGECNYQNGDLIRIDPKDHQSIENIGLARQHLQQGYPEIWKKKQELTKGILSINNEIANVINEFEQIIILSIPTDFKARENIVSEDDLSFLPCYFQRHTFSYLFEQVNRKLDGKPVILPSIKDRKSHLQPPSGEVISYETSFLFIGLYELALGEKWQLDQFKVACNGLISNEQLNELVKRYRNLKTRLVECNAEGYYSDIDNLWKEIFENGNTLEGKGVCKQCPKHTFLDYF